MTLASYICNSNRSSWCFGESSHEDHMMSSKTAQTPKSPTSDNQSSKGKPQDKKKSQDNSNDDGKAGAEDESTDSDADSTTGGKDGGKRGGTKDPKAKR